MGRIRGNKPYLASVGLADEACSIGGRVTVLVETQTLYVRVDGYTG